MRTLHLGLRVADLERSLAFYEAVGFEVVGSVTGTSLGDLTMLKLPDDEFVTLELVSDPPSDRRPGLSHLVVSVESAAATVAALASKGIDTAPPETRTESDGIRTASITDPDGNSIELVQWPAGHPDGMTAADLPA